MAINKKGYFYLFSLLLITVFLFGSVFIVYKYVRNQVKVSSASSDWVSLELSNNGNINLNKSSAYINNDLEVMEAQREYNNFVNIKYADNLAYGGALAVDKINGFLFSCSYNGCYKKTKQNNDWQLVLDDYAVTNVELSPNFEQDQTVIAAGLYGVYLSTDQGKNWQKVNDEISMHIGSLEFSPNYAEDHTIFINDYKGGLYKSYDNGKTWQLLEETENINIVNFVLSPNYKEDQTLWLSSKGQGIYKSIDAGETFIPVNEGLQSLRTGTLAVSPNYIEDKTLFLTLIDENNALYKSVDEGKTWQDLEVDLNSSMRHILWKVFISPNYAEDQKLLLSDYTGRYLWYSENQGKAWSQSNVNDVVGEKGAVNKIFPDNSIISVDGQTIWLSSLNHNGLLKSDNGGKTWQSLATANLNTGSVVDIQYSPNYLNDKELWLVDQYLGPMVSNDNGQTWQSRIKGLEKYNLTADYEDFYLQDFYISPTYSEDKTLFIFFSSYHNRKNFFYKSTDAGKTWDLVNFPKIVIPWQHQMVFSSNYQNDKTILLSIAEAGFFISKDEGNSWQEIDLEISGKVNNVISLNNNDYIFTTYDNKIYYYNGIDLELLNLGNKIITDIVLSNDYESSGKFYAISQNNIFLELRIDQNKAIKILRSHDLGLADNYQATNLLSIEEDNSQKLFISGKVWHNNKLNNSYYYQSLDNGFTWLAVDNNFQHNNLFIQAHGNLANEQYLGTLNEGLLRNYKYQINPSVFQSNILTVTVGGINKVTLLAEEKNLEAGSIQYYVSATGGKDWSPIKNGQTISVDKIGNLLSFKAVISSADGDFSPQISNIELFYETGNINSNISGFVLSENNEDDIFPEKVANLHLYNLDYNEVKISNNADLSSDDLNSDSGKWLQFVGDDVYENWLLDPADNSKIYLQFRKKSANSYKYSKVIAVPKENLHLLAELSKKVEELNVAEYSDYNLDRFMLKPFLLNGQGNVIWSEQAEQNKNKFVFTDLSGQPFIEIFYNKNDDIYSFVLNNFSDKDFQEYELWVREYYDKLIIRDDYITSNLSKSHLNKEISRADLLKELRAYHQQNYIEVFSEENYKGLTEKIYLDKIDLTYNLFANNISSIKFYQQSDFSIEVYSDSSFKGLKDKINSDLPSLAKLNVGNNNISSIKFIYEPQNKTVVVPANSPCYAQGNLQSPVLFNTKEKSEYEVLWRDGDFYKVKLSPKQEAWFFLN